MVLSNAPGGAVGYGGNSSEVRDGTQGRRRVDYALLDRFGVYTSITTGDPHFFKLSVGSDQDFCS